MPERALEPVKRRAGCREPPAWALKQGNLAPFLRTGRAPRLADSEGIITFSIASFLLAAEPSTSTSQKASPGYCPASLLPQKPAPPPSQPPSVPSPSNAALVLQSTQCCQPTTHAHAPPAQRPCPFTFQNHSPCATSPHPPTLPIHPCFPSATQPPPAAKRLIAYVSTNHHSIPVLARTRAGVRRVRDAAGKEAAMRSGKAGPPRPPPSRYLLTRSRRTLWPGCKQTMSRTN